MFKTKDQINIKELVDEYNSIEKGEFKPRVLKGLFGDIKEYDIDKILKGGTNV